MTTPAMNVPQPGYPRPRWGFGLVVGLVAGLVLGGGVVGLVWALSSTEPEGTTADAQAVCGIVERTKEPALSGDFTAAEANRWAGAAALAESIGESGLYQPLAAELKKVMEGVQRFDVPELKKATARVRELCADI